MLAPQAPRIPADYKALRLRKDTTSRNQRKEVALDTRHDGTSPTLRRLAEFGHKAVAMFLNVGRNPAGPSALFVAKGTEGLPLFLCSTNLKPFVMTGTQPFSLGAKSVEYGAVFKSVSAILSEESVEAVNGSKAKEQTLQTLIEIHMGLVKTHTPRKTSRAYAMHYEKTIGRSAVEAGSLVTLTGRDKIEITVENRNSKRPMNQREGEMAEGGEYGRIVTSIGSSRLFAGTPHLVTEHLPEDHALRLKSDVFVLAGKLLDVFVPEGYDALIISKYWGAVHELLRQDVLLFANSPVAEIVASHLSKLYERVQDVRLGMRTNDGSQPTLHELPKSFTAAFQQLLLFVVAGNMAELYEDNLSNPDFVLPFIARSGR